MLTQTVAVTKTGVLILARLLAAPAKFTPAKLRDSLKSFFRGCEPGAWHDLIGETLAALESDRLITLKPLALTETGRAQTLERFGLEPQPKGVKWQTIKSKHLVPIALGLSAEDAQKRELVASADGLRATVIQHHYNLPPVTSPKQAMDALVWKELGFDGVTDALTIGLIRERALSQVLKLTGKFDADRFIKQLPAHATGAIRSGTDDIRTAILREWVGKELMDDATPLEESEPLAQQANEVEISPIQIFDLAGFADRVRSTARTSETGRFGDNKVFISHVWRALQRENAFPDMTESEFKARLTEANHAGLLALSRADLVEVMDRADVEASEARYLHAVFHFLQV